MAPRLTKAAIAVIHPLRKPSRDKLPSMRCRDPVRAPFSPNRRGPRTIRPSTYDHRERLWGPRCAIATRPLEILYQEKSKTEKRSNHKRLASALRHKPENICSV